MLREIFRPIFSPIFATPTTLVKGGVRYDPAAAALFERFTTPPTSARKTIINNMIVALKDAGVWEKLDALYIMAAADAQAARRNWVQDAYNLVAVSSPAFAIDRGYTGDGTNGYLESSFNPTTAPSPKFTQNDAHLGMWSLTNDLNGASTSYDIGWQGISTIRRSVTSGRIDGRPNTSGDTVIAPGVYPGHGMWSRSASALWESYAQGVDVGGGANASGPQVGGTFKICAVTASALGVNQMAVGHWGGDLTAAQAMSLYTALQSYLSAVGAV